MSHRLVTLNSLRGRLYREAVRRRAVALPYAPFTIYIDPCNACNLRCTFCPQSNWGLAPRGRMPWELFEQALAEAIELKPSRLFLFCFGEATLHKDLPRMIRAATDGGLRVRIHTNAMAVEEDLARELVKSGLHECVFSFDTPDAELYNRLRVRSDFDTALANIRRVIQVRDELGSARPEFHLQELIPDEAGHEGKPANTQAYLDLFQGLRVRFKAKYMHSFAGQNTEEEFAKMRSAGTTHCSQLYRRIVVNFDGKVHACCLDAHGHNVVGDLTAGDTIAGAWNSRAMQILRRRTNEGDVTGLPPCDECEILYQRSRQRGNWLTRMLDNLAWKCLHHRAE